MDFKSKLRHVKDFPKKGIDFIDITTILQDSKLYSSALEEMKKGMYEFEEFDLIAAPESRGFVFGSALAYMMNKGFVPIRKKGKLPYDTISVSYELEYGTDTLEMHSDAVKRDQKVVIVDDLLATGGTTGSNIKLVERLGGKVVGVQYFIELSFLKGREKFSAYDVKSIVKF
jgi:adenine phosphoribosyltransferase